MGKPVNPGQALQILSVLALNTDWTQLDADDIQRKIVDKPKDAGAAFTAWLQNGCRLSSRGPKVLAIDRSRPSDPTEDWVGCEGWYILSLRSSEQYGEQNRISKFVRAR